MKKETILLMFFIFFLMTNFSSAGLKDGLITYYNFEEGSGTVTADKVGNVNLALINMDDSNWVEGKINKALLYKGWQYAKNEVSNLKLSNKFSVQAWFNATQFGSYQTLISYLDDREVGFIITKSGDSYELLFLVINQAGLISNEANSVKTSAIDPEKWYHIIGVYDGEKIQVYLDGKLENTLPFTGTISSTNPKLRIGLHSNLDQPERYWGGVIDEVAIWNRSLDQVDVENLYNLGRGLNLSSLLNNDFTPEFSNACGSVIKENTVLDSNLNCPDTAIVIGADNIILDCAGHTIAGNFINWGINSTNKKNITIKNCIVKKYFVGITLDSTNESYIINNTVKFNQNGFFIGPFSNFNIISDNLASDNIERDFNLGSSNFNNFTNNFARISAGSTGYLLQDSSFNNFFYNNVSGNAIGFYLFRLNSSNFLYNKVDDSAFGFLLGLSNSNDFNLNIVKDNSEGFILTRDSMNNSLSNNLIENNKNRGFTSQDGATSNKLFNNTIIKNLDGIFITNQIYIGSNVIESNIIKDNIESGIKISSSLNRFTNNIIVGNKNGLILLDTNTQNLFYNNIFNNTINVEDGGDNNENYWNITKTPGKNIVGGPFIGGNFWSDYKGIDTSRDGLGDTELPYNANNEIAIGGDFLPLTLVDVVAPKITINFPTSNKPYYNVSTIQFNVSLDELGMCNYTLNKGKKNYTMQSTDGINFYTIVNLRDGGYNIIYYCSDLFGNNNATSSRKFSIDTKFPIIKYGVNTVVDGVIVPQNWIFVNVSVIEKNFQNITYYLFDNNNFLINRTSYSKPKFFINFTKLNLGNYLYNVTITDRANNINSTETRSIQLI